VEEGNVKLDSIPTGWAPAPPNFLGPPIYGMPTQQPNFCTVIKLNATTVFTGLTFEHWHLSS